MLKTAEEIRKEVENSAYEYDLKKVEQRLEEMVSLRDTSCLVAIESERLLKELAEAGYDVQLKKECINETFNVYQISI